MQNRIPSFFPVAMVKVRNPKRLVAVAVIFFSIVLAFVVWTFLPPNPNVLYSNRLTEEEKQAIRNSILREHDEMIRWNYVDPYYGKINGCYIVVMHPYGSTTAEWQQEIAGYTFKWGEPIQLYAYSKDHGNPTSCELSVAYEKGWLTEQQIGEIYEKHNEYYADFPQMMEQYLKESNNSQK